MKNIVILGAGPGMGEHVAAEFGALGFHAVLLGRNADRLEACRRDLAARGFSADTLVADAGDFASLADAFRTIEARWGRPDVLVHNAADTRVETELPSAQELSARLDVEVASIMTCVEWLRSSQTPAERTLLLTGGGLAINPHGIFTGLSTSKAALRALALCLHEKLRPEGIFVGTVTICGAEGSDDFFSPANIAKDYRRLYEERGSCEIVHARTAASEDLA